MKTSAPFGTPKRPRAPAGSITLWTDPEPTDVIHYTYLWRGEAQAGEEEGRKTRPCLVLAVTPSKAGLRVIVAPITTRNYDPSNSVEIPPRVIAHLGLDDRSRVVCNDLNRFIWVGPDVTPRRKGTPYYGQVPERLWRLVLKKVIANAVRATERTE